jgi:hypothetical protein
MYAPSHGPSSNNFHSNVIINVDFGKPTNQLTSEGNLFNISLNRLEVGKEDG